MPLTYEERVEVLKKARAIKAEKALAKKAENNEVKPVTPEVTPEEKPQIPEEKPVITKKTKNKKKDVTPTKTLTIKEEPVKEEPDKTEEIITEEIIEVRRKPKKKVVKKIIYESNSEDEIIEEIEVKEKKPVKPVKSVKPVKQEKQNNPFFNY